jgi:hypothetical protein
MDRATWELMLQLQHREITPEDYTVLVELDNSVQKPSLAKRKLRLFPTARVAECAGGSVVRLPHAQQALSSLFDARFKEQCGV